MSKNQNGENNVKIFYLCISTFIHFAQLRRFQVTLFLSKCKDYLPFCHYYWWWDDPASKWRNLSAYCRPWRCPKSSRFFKSSLQVSKNETGETLQSIWAEGSNSFAQDPPNAVVIINQQVQTIVILNMNIEGDQTVFNIRADGPQSLVEMSGPMQIFVDGNSGVLNKNACGLSC